MKRATRLSILVIFMLANFSCISWIDPMPSARPQNPPLHKAADAGDEAKVRKLLSKKRTRIDRLSIGRTALVYAVSNKNYEIAELLLQAGANPDIPTTSTGLAPIHDAALNGDLKLVKLLVEHGSNPRLQGMPPNETWTPIRAASRNKHWDVVRYIRSAKQNSPLQ